MKPSAPNQVNKLKANQEKHQMIRSCLKKKIITKLKWITKITKITMITMITMITKKNKKMMLIKNNKDRFKMLCNN